MTRKRLSHSIVSIGFRRANWVPICVSPSAIPRLTERYVLCVSRNTAMNRIVDARSSSSSLPAFKKYLIGVALTAGRQRRALADDLTRHSICIVQRKHDRDALSYRLRSSHESGFGELGLLGFTVEKASTSSRPACSSTRRQSLWGRHARKCRLSRSAICSPASEPPPACLSHKGGA